jgi:LysM repeat protein
MTVWTKISSSRAAALLLALLATLLLAPVPAGADTEHVVEQGETLGALAAHYGVAVEALQAWNRILDANTIIEGDTISIPDSAGRAATVGAAPTVTTQYVVQAGETLSSIAGRFGVSVSSLAAANAISDVDLIRDGVPLTIPGGASAPTSTTIYVVQAGDSLSSIAARFGTSVAAVAAANAISNLDLVRIGSRITLPEGSGSGGASVSAAPGGGAEALIDQWAAHYGVPADLLKALTWFESGWNNRLTSSTGAIGIGQLMPDTVVFVSSVLIGLPLDPHNPGDNVRMSARFLSYLLDQTGEPRLAIAAYYQGLGSLRRHGIYNSSIFYVDGILALRSRF